MPLSVFLYTGFVRTLPRDYEEAAQIDGASPSTTFRKIVFPLLGPATGTVAILTSLIIWNDFFTSLVFLSGSEAVTLPVVVYSFVGELVSKWNVIFAAVHPLDDPVPRVLPVRAEEVHPGLRRRHQELIAGRRTDFVPGTSEELCPTMNILSADLNLLVALDALLQERNVTRAGARIGVSQSAMSSALSRLRRQFDDELLTRVGTRYELTPLAQVLTDRVAEVLAPHRENAQFATDLSSRPRRPGNSGSSGPTTRSAC